MALPLPTVLALLLVPPQLGLPGLTELAAFVLIAFAAPALCLRACPTRAARLPLIRGVVFVAPYPGLFLRLVHSEPPPHPSP